MFADNPAAWTILASNVVFSLLGLYGYPGLLQKNLFRPYWMVRGKQYASVVLSCFLHVNTTHLLLNMLTFYFFAFPMERVIGMQRFVALYVIALLCGQVGTWLKQRNNPRYASLGASGAVSGVLLAYIVYFPTHSLYLFFIPIPIPAFAVAAGFLVYSWYASGRENSLINHDAHLYGALGGLVFVAITDFTVYKNLARIFS